jgi:hypothetical protein
MWPQLLSLVNFKRRDEQYFKLLNIDLNGLKYSYFTGDEVIRALLHAVMATDLSFNALFSAWFLLYVYIACDS